MNILDPKALLNATWPPAEMWDLGPFQMRDGAGADKRVSAATAEDEWDFEALQEAEAAMPAPLFAIWPGDEMLDQALAFKSYHLIDPVRFYHASIEQILASAQTGAHTAAVDGDVALPHWPPLAICEQIWQEGGIDAPRLAVMARVTGPKTVILARLGRERAAGVCFVAVHEDQAMLHALEVRPDMRGQGIGQVVLTAAAAWAKSQGASGLSLVVTDENTAACRLYEKMGMDVTSRYHYRMA